MQERRKACEDRDSKRQSRIATTPYNIVDEEVKKNEETARKR
jgi:hypothetical protein